MVFFSYKIKKMIAFKWMVERKQEPPWGGIKQLNFPSLSASPTTALNGKGHRTLQQNISETRCTTAPGHDMPPGHPAKASLSATWQEQRVGQQTADQNQRGGRESGEKRQGCSSRRKRCAPIKVQWRGRGFLSPSTQEAGHLDWVPPKRQPLSNPQLHHTINANINRQCLGAVPSTLRTWPHLILSAALCKVILLAPFERWGH